MARIRRVKKQPIGPDLIYNNKLLNKFIHSIMHDGKKSVAQKEVYEALDKIKTQGQDPLQVFQSALQNVGPKMEVRPRRVGGASYQVPIEVRGERRVSLAIRWIREAARKRSNKEFHTFADKLAAELTDAAKGGGEAIKKRDITYRMAR